MVEFLNELNDLDAVSLDLVIVQKSFPAKTKGENLMVVFDVADKTKTLKARYFGTANECTKFYNRLEQGKVYRIVGKYSDTYHSITINVNELMFVTDPDWNKLKREISPNDEQIQELNKYIATITTLELKILLEKLFARPDLMNKLAVWPAASAMHHAYPNGLITHILEMLKIADGLLSIYPKANRDLLYCGCILHDLGKIIELDAEFGTVYSDKGKLLTHIPMGFFIVGEILVKETQCSDDLSNQILHMILSHHGTPTDKIPGIVRPKTLEAVMLHQIDMLSSQVAPIHDEVGKKSGWVKIGGGEYYISDNTLTEGSVG